MRRAALILLAACGGSSNVNGDAPGADTSAAAPQVFVNEVMPSNTGACADEFGEYDDWVELYNAGDADIDLGGYTVTDDTTMPAKAVLPAGVTVPAHGFTVLWADGQVQGTKHLSFKLEAKGEQFALYTPDGALVDSITFGMATTDVSFARLPDGTGAFASCAYSTCGASNGSSCPGVR